MELKLIQVREAIGNSIHSSHEVAVEMQEEAKADRECFWVLHLTTDKKVIEKELISMGNINNAIVCPREVFKKAIINSACSIITIHNHPSGNSEPSIEDRKIWAQLDKAGEILGIGVEDNLIITGKGEFYSDRSKFNYKL